MTLILLINIAYSSENAATPYAATIIINDMHYSTGYGSSKKQAKTEAAKATLEILLPELGEKIREESNTKGDADLSVSSIFVVTCKDNCAFGIFCFTRGVIVKPFFLSFFDSSYFY